MADLRLIRFDQSLQAMESAAYDAHMNGDLRNPQEIIAELEERLEQVRRAAFALGSAAGRPTLDDPRLSGGRADGWELSENAEVCQPSENQTP